MWAMLTIVSPPQVNFTIYVGHTNFQSTTNLWFTISADHVIFIYRKLMWVTIVVYFMVHFVPELSNTQGVDI
jgi:hypothetical protein